MHWIFNTRVGIPMRIGNGKTTMRLSLYILKATRPVGQQADFCFQEARPSNGLLPLEIINKEET